MHNKLPQVPRICYGIVDVRNVAEAHINALLRADKADGKRFILSDESFFFIDVANILREEFASKGYTIPDNEVGEGKLITFDSSSTKQDLGINFIKIKKSVIEMTYKMIDLGMIEKKDK